MTDARLHSPACDRNQGPILDELQRLLPATGRMLEIAAGSGQHAAHFARHFSGWQWQPTDPDAAALASINAWAAQADAPNLQPALRLDVLATPWPVAGPFDAVFNANLLHISPWATCAALMHGAAACLTPGGRLITYGPYRVDGEATAPSNLAFDASLRQRDPAWGLRWLHEVQATAAGAGLTLHERVTMPANNLLLVWARA
jgi:SAM-dependent methyltransferase